MFYRSGVLCNPQLSPRARHFSNHGTWLSATKGEMRRLLVRTPHRIRLLASLSIVRNWVTRTN